MKMFKPVAVVHCAASTQVGASFEKPTNIMKIIFPHLIELIGACIENEVQNFVFISSKQCVWRY